ncbi:ester cyclase [Kitasatospora cinereorecta]|uniref:Ester cyclase n=1 Tax=Kitasatospora cinereorecta TaxID=285560 RepID=A0ABW0V574_9ACTN
MTFVQIVDCKTDQVDALNSLMDTWVEQTKGRRTAARSIVGTDRENLRHVVEIVEFPSYEEAMRNSDLPETDRVFREMVALCDEPPTFTNLDVVRDEQLNKLLATRFFEIANGPDEAGLDEFVAEDYRDHDPAAPRQSASREDLRRVMRMWKTGFDFRMTVEHMMADGDTVCCRWSMTGKHTGEFMELLATDKVVEMTGITTMRFQDGMLREAWWQYDNAGLMKQLGLIRM